MSDQDLIRARLDDQLRVARDKLATKWGGTRNLDLVEALVDAKIARALFEIGPADEVRADTDAPAGLTKD